MKQYCATTKHFATCHHLLQFALLLCRLPKTHFRLSYFRRYFVFTHTRPCILCLCHHCSVAFFSLMPATCFTVLLFCFLAFRFIIVWHFYASTTSICTTLLSLQLDILFARSTKITSTTFRIYCICNFIAVCMCVIVRKILQKKSSGNNSWGRVRVKQRHTLLSASTECSTVTLLAHPRILGAFQCVFLSFKIDNRKRKYSLHWSVARNLSFSFFFFAKARNLWRWKKKRLRNMRWKVVSWHLI